MYGDVNLVKYAYVNMSQFSFTSNWITADEQWKQYNFKQENVQVDNLITSKLGAPSPVVQSTSHPTRVTHR